MELKVINGLFGDYYFLNNSFMSPIYYMDCKFPTVTNAYVASAYNDAGTHREVSSLPPMLAENFLKDNAPREEWFGVRMPLLRMFLGQKFGLFSSTDHAEERYGMAKRLLTTAPDHIVHRVRNHDTFLGHCECSDCPAGENLLGYMLMIIRSSLFRKLQEVKELKGVKCSCKNDPIGKATFYEMANDSVTKTTIVFCSECRDAVEENAYDRTIDEEVEVTYWSRFMDLESEEEPKKENRSRSPWHVPQIINRSPVPIVKERGEIWTPPPMVSNVRTAHNDNAWKSPEKPERKWSSKRFGASPASDA